MFRDEYIKVISENFDIMDRNTRKILVNINENDQNEVLSSLASKLYKMIMSQVDKIDYGKIPESKGDITKIPNYAEIVECLDIMRSIINNNKQSTANIDTINKAIENLILHKSMWQKGFNTKSSLTITTYNTIALAIVSATSLMISSSIEFIKDPEIRNFDIALNNVAYGKTKDYLLFKNLEEFNKACSNGDINKIFETVIKSDINVKEMTEIYEESNSIFYESILGTMAIIAKGAGIGLFAIQALKIVLPLLQNLVWVLLNSKQKLSDYFAIQSDLLRLNAQRIEYNQSKSDKEKENIYKKQIKLADSFKKLSVKLAVKMKDADNKAKKEIEKAKKDKFKIDDVVDELPDSAPVIF